MTWLLTITVDGRTLKPTLTAATVWDALKMCEARWPGARFVRAVRRVN